MGEEKLKRCAGCHLLLTAERFHKNAAQHDGLSTACKSCRSAEHRAMRMTRKKGSPEAAEAELADIKARGRQVPSTPDYYAMPDGTVARVRYGFVRWPVARESLGGYLRISVAEGPSLRGSRLVHRMVCEAFHGPPPTPDAETRHLNGNPKDNRPENLAWGTAKENALDRERHKTEREVVARVVAWLRAEAAKHDGPMPGVDPVGSVLVIADAIERGDWRNDHGR